MNGVDPFQSRDKPRTLPPELGFLQPVVIPDLTRYGVRGDGGYLLPATRVEHIDGVISFGLCYDWTFEHALAIQRPRIPIHVYDHTAGLPLLRRNVLAGFAKALLGRAPFSDLTARLRRYRDYGSFFQDNRHHFRERVSRRVELRFDATIDGIFERMSGKRRLLLKMDIEGSEYEVIPQILEYGHRIDVMAIEFHDAGLNRKLFTEQVRAIQSMFAIVHLHANNYAGTASDGLPETIEISFMKLRRASPRSPRRRSLPLDGLDFPCDPRRPDQPLVFS